MNNHKDQVSAVTFDEIVLPKKIPKKTTNLLLVPNKRHQDFSHLIQNPKLPKNIIGFYNHK